MTILTCPRQPLFGARARGRGRGAAGFGTPPPPPSGSGRAALSFKPASQLFPVQSWAWGSPYVVREAIIDSKAVAWRPDPGRKGLQSRPWRPSWQEQPLLRRSTPTPLHRQPQPFRARHAPAPPGRLRAGGRLRPWTWRNTQRLTPGLDVPEMRNGTPAALGTVPGKDLF